MQYRRRLGRRALSVDDGRGRRGAAQRAGQPFAIRRHHAAIARRAERHDSGGTSTAGLRANGDYTTVTDSTFAWNGWHGITTDGYGYPLALGRTSFINNNLSAAQEYSILGLLDMGGNVCAQTCQ
jgi:hypothetical protein